MSKQEKVRMGMVAMVLCIGMIALYHMAVNEDWGTLVTSILGIAGFVLTWEVTKQEE